MNEMYWGLVSVRKGTQVYRSGSEWYFRSHCSHCSGPGPNKDPEARIWYPKIETLSININVIIIISSSSCNE
jgi:hypothetical protein